MNIWLALALTFIISIFWLRLIDFLAHRGLINSGLSRKIIHIGTGPIFVLCWLLFEDSPYARYLAALIPALITAQFAMVGSGIIKDQASVDAMSRTGDRKEILRGPLFYGIVFVILTIWFWKDNVIGIVALMLLCGGDGLADIIGQRVGKKNLPWCASKTWAGSLAMFLGGWGLTILILEIYRLAGQYSTPFGVYLLPLTIISVVAVIVESLPLKDLDNITVPAVAVLLGFCFTVL